MFFYKFFFIYYILTLYKAVTYEYYKGNQIFEVWANASGKTDLHNFATEEGFDIHSFAKSKNRPVHIMVTPEKIPIFQDFLEKRNYEWKIKADVQKAVKKELLKNSFFKTRKNKDPTSEFLSYSEIVEYVHSLHKMYPNNTRLIFVGDTVLKRPIFGIKVSKQGVNPNHVRPIIFIDGLIHAREWISGSMVLHILKELLQNPEVEDLLYADWVILPVLNPDGYMFSFQSRMWRKNRQKTETSNNRKCIGTDLNRNYNYHWMESGASDNPCDPIFAGPSAFSELESKNFKTFVHTINKNKDIKLYISFHAYGAMILYPWSYKNKLPSNYKLFDRLSKGFQQAVKDYSGTSFIEGPSATTIYESAGSSDDWMHGEAGVPLAFTIELPGESFQEETSNILPIVKETFVGVKYLARTVINMLKNNEPLL